MDHKKYQEDNGSCCEKCLGCIMCCNLPASAGVKILSVFSILLGLVYCCLGVWTLIVTASNGDLPARQQLFYEISTGSETANDPSQGIYVTNPKKLVPLSSNNSYLIALGCIALGCGFVRTLSSIFLLWNSVEKHNILPAKVWIMLTSMGTTTIITYLLVFLNITGFISDIPLISPVRVLNDKFSFYILITIFRCICFSDIFLSIYFVFIVHWFVRTR